MKPAISMTIFALLFLMAGCSSNKNIAARYETAMVAYQQGRFSDAEPALRKLVQEYPHFAEGWFRLGNLYIRTDQNEAAIASFKECLKHDPNYSKAWHNLSLSYMKMAVGALDEGLDKGNFQAGDRSSIEALKAAILAVGSDTTASRQSSTTSP